MRVDAGNFGFVSRGGSPSRHVFALEVWDKAGIVLAVVADGVGDAPQAEEKARRTVATFLACYEKRPRGLAPGRVLRQCVLQTLHRLALLGNGARLAASLAAVAVDGDRIHGFNLGSTRICLGRRGKVTHLARPSSPASVPSGAPAWEMPSGDEAQAYFFEEGIEDGDRLLLCSCGVTERIGDTLLAREFAWNAPAQEGDVAPERPQDMGAVVIHVYQKVSREIPAALKQGDALDGFRLLRPLRQDGRTWLAEKQGNRRVLRFPEAAARDDAALLDRFLDEAADAVRLGETGFFPWACIPEDSSHRYYATAFVEAPTLRSVLDER